jgi:5-methylcytosine-specific restriction enzyme subunit McrC
VSIPVRNIYYLLCYAWDRFEAKDSVRVSEDAADSIENLFAEVLRVGVSTLLRSGMDRGYQPERHETRQPRGKILVTETLQRLLLQQGRLICEQTELTHDVPHNRAIKAAMLALIRTPSVDKKLAISLRALSRRMSDVADRDLRPELFRHIQLHRNVASYGLLLDVSRLISKSLLPDPKSGGVRFHPFASTNQEMGLVFQSFVYNFWKREQDEYKVSAPKVKWDVEDVGGHSSWLPDMQTDIALTSNGRRFIIETKYSSEPFHQWNGGQKKLTSSHLYQLMSYLSHYAATTGEKPVGVLLYAGEGVGERLNLQISGFTVLVRSVKLDRDWSEIRRDMLSLPGELASVR